MSIRLMLASFALAAPATAAPLCHDLRGLYTPCAPGQAPRLHASHKQEASHADMPKADRARLSEQPAAAARPAAPAKPALVDRGKKFCHDSKGLYTPCPR